MKLFISFMAGLAVAGGAAFAQGVSPSHVFGSHLIVPSARSFAPHPAGTVEITEVNVAVDILEQVTTTTMDISLANPTGLRLEAQMLVPVPDKAALRGFTFHGSASEPTAELLPKVKELVDEIVRLSKEFGVLTEYTAFFAREGTHLTQPVNVALETFTNFPMRAMATRSGYGSVNQSFNNNAQISQGCVNSRNGYWDANMNRVSISTFQQVNDRAFLRRGNRWVDSSLVDKAEAAPKNVVEVGSPEFRRLAERLAAQSRQGCVALNGEILLNVDGETILVR